MRGGTNNGMKVQGNCLKPSKSIQGSKKTRPTPRLKTQNVDTKVTLISPEQLTSLKTVLIFFSYRTIDYDGTQANIKPSSASKTWRATIRSTHTLCKPSH